MLVPSYSCLSLYDHQLDCTSHTNSESKPSHATQGIFTPDALPATTLSIFGLGDWLRVCCIMRLGC